MFIIMEIWLIFAKKLSIWLCVFWPATVMQLDHTQAVDGDSVAVVSTILFSSVLRNSLRHYSIFHSSCILGIKSEFQRSTPPRRLNLTTYILFSPRYVTTDCPPKLALLTSIVVEDYTYRTKVVHSQGANRV